MSSLREDTTIAAQALEFIILTATRFGSAVSAEWSQIDFEKRIWNIPAGEMKQRRFYSQPLSDAALRVLEEMKAYSGSSGLIFPSPDTGDILSDQGVSKVIRRHGVEKGEATIHGFRSSFRTWAEKNNKGTHAIRELCLSHMVSGDLEKAYIREGVDLDEEKAKILNDWSRFCYPAKADVVPIKAG